MSKKIYDISLNKTISEYDDNLKELYLYSYDFYNLDFLNKIIPIKDIYFSKNSIINYFNDFKSRHKMYPNISSFINTLESIINYKNEYRLILPIEILEMYLSEKKNYHYFYMRNTDYKYFNYTEEFVIENLKFVKDNIIHLKSKLPKTLNMDLFRELNNIGKDDMFERSLEYSHKNSTHKRTNLDGITDDMILNYYLGFDIPKILRDDINSLSSKIINNENIMKDISLFSYNFDILKMLIKREDCDKKIYKSFVIDYIFNRRMCYGYLQPEINLDETKKTVKKIFNEFKFKFNLSELDSLDSFNKLNKYIISILDKNNYNRSYEHFAKTFSYGIEFIYKVFSQLEKMNISIDEIKDTLVGINANDSLTGIITQDPSNIGLFEKVQYLGKELNITFDDIKNHKNFKYLYKSDCIILKGLLGDK